MEYCTDNKRFRVEFDDSLADSAESKLRRLNSTESRFEGPEGHDLRIDLPEPEELLNILEDVDSAVERDESIQGLELDSFIRSFEEEIQAQPPAKTASDRNETPQAELGYLFEASDDELGLPPTVGSSSSEGKMEAIDFMPVISSPGLFQMDGNLGFEDDIPCYDSFEIGTGIGSAAEEEFVALGGLFDYSDVPFRPESLSAL